MLRPSDRYLLWLVSRDKLRDQYPGSSHTQGRHAAQRDELPACPLAGESGISSAADRLLLHTTRSAPPSMLTLQTLTGLHALSGCAGCYFALERGAFVSRLAVLA
jgi:hypothetical protein